MIRIAIVGPQEDKWTKEQKTDARVAITTLLIHAEFPTLVSGGCPNGGVDIWAEEIADSLGIEKRIIKPDVTQWEDKIRYYNGYNPMGIDRGEVYGFVDEREILMGYKSRNIMIARECDILYCIVPKTGDEDSTWLPTTFCKHCKEWGHPNNGGCWTMQYAKKLGKETHLVIIQ